MTQELHGLFNDALRTHNLPDPEVEVIPGVYWGNAAAVFTPAYWAHILWLSEAKYQRSSSGRCNTLPEQIAFCLLGGYGITWEMNHAAFHEIRSRGLFEEPARIEAILREPLDFDGRKARYRFPKKKSAILAGALQSAARHEFDDKHSLVLREQLLKLPGVGWKTASWIVREWICADDVAILDIHIIRAGMLMGLYSANDKVERHYPEMERRFVALATSMCVRTSELDLLIWEEMRSSNHFAIAMLEEMAVNQKAIPAQKSVKRRDIRAQT